MCKKTYILFLTVQSFLPPLNYTNTNSLLSVLIAQLRESNLSQSVIRMNNISEILLNTIFRIYASVSHGLDNRCLNNVNHLVDRKTMAASLRQNVSDFYLNTEKLFFLEILF